MMIAEASEPDAWTGIIILGLLLTAVDVGIVVGTAWLIRFRLVRHRLPLPAAIGLQIVALFFVLSFSVVVGSNLGLLDLLSLPVAMRILRWRDRPVDEQTLGGLGTGAVQQQERDR